MGRLKNASDGNIEDCDPDIDFILALIRNEPPPVGGTNIDMLLRKTLYHRLVPLLHSRLERLISQGKLQPEAEEPVKTLYHSETLRTVALAEEFKRFSAILSESGVRFIVLKGIYLAREIYPPGEKRQFADIDLLVKDSDMGRVETIIFKEGYRLFDVWQNRVQLEKSVEFGLARSYYKESAHFLQLDMHTKLAMAPGRRYIPDEFVWGTALNCEVVGVPAMKLATETEMVYLCWHMLKHAYCRLGWLKDLRLFVAKNPELKEGKLFARFAALMRVKKVVAMALRLVSEAFHDPELKEWAKTFSRRTVNNTIPYFSLNNYLQLRDDLSGGQRFRRDLALIGSLGDLTRYLWNSAFPPPVLVVESEKEISSRLSPAYIRHRFSTALKTAKR